MHQVDDKALDGFRFIDLFAGIGGFHLAMSSLGALCVYASEWDRHASHEYAVNFDMTPDGDITKINEHDIPDHDILCAGFPCQAFSISGKQRGFEDTRGTLFFDVARIVREKRPRVVLMENVKNLTRHDDGRTFQVIRDTMTRLGYSFDYAVLNAADYGVPQSRERVYMVCFRDEPTTFTFPKPVTLTRHVENILLQETEISDSMTRIPMDIEDAGSYANHPIRLGSVKQGRQGERVYSTKGTAITLSAYGGGVFSKTGGYLIDGYARKLVPRECARLMGFPDSYVIDVSDSQAYKQFGNSVVVDVLQEIGKNIGTSIGQV